MMMMMMIRRSSITNNNNSILLLFLIILASTAVTMTTCSKEGEEATINNNNRLLRGINNVDVDDQRRRLRSPPLYGDKVGGKHYYDVVPEEHADIPNGIYFNDNGSKHYDAVVAGGNPEDEFEFEYSINDTGIRIQSNNVEIDVYEIQEGNVEIDIKEQPPEFGSTYLRPYQHDEPRSRSRST